MQELFKFFEVFFILILGKLKSLNTSFFTLSQGIIIVCLKYQLVLPSYSEKIVLNKLTNNKLNLK